MEKIDLTMCGDKPFLGMADKLLETTREIFPSPEIAVVGLIAVAMHLAQEHSIPDEFIQSALTALDQASNQEGLMQ